MSETDTDGLRLLSLDGGGIRGLSTLLILENIMHRIKIEESLEDTPNPCEYFDLIGGTSTGGIIALMLGRLRMSVKDAIKCYDDLTGKVFSKVGWGGGGKYNTPLLEEVIKAIVKQRTDESETQLLDDGHLGGICKTFVCAMNAHNMNARIPVLFRTYESPKEVSIPCTIWQAARATSASPTFFERVFIGPTSRLEPFIDGGVCRNNPTIQVLEEAELMFPNRTIACVISIGTGKPETINVPNPGLFERNVVPVGVINALVAMATDCEDTAQQMEKRFKHWLKTYFRFNVEQGMQNVKPGDWERMSEVSAHTRSYMNMHEVDQRLVIAVKAIREQKGIINTSAINAIPNQDLPIHGPTDVNISPSYIPEKPLHFFGRDEEREEIIQALLNSESIIIPGSGGMGKTTLALAVLHDDRVISSEHFQSRVYFVDCRTIPTLEALYGRLAVDLRVPKDQCDSHIHETLLRMFRNMGPAVLCLDNFETLWDVYEARDDIDTMLSRFYGIQTLALLLTTRGTHRPTKVRWSKASPSSLRRLSNGALTDIFREESQLPDVDEHAQKLIDVADGMPLTITLLARLAQIETPKATWTRWTTNGTSIANQGPGPTTNLDVSIELSLGGPRLKDDISAIQTLGILAHLPDGLAHPSDITRDLQSRLPDDVDLSTALHKLVTVGLAYIDTAKNGRYRVLSPISTYAITRKLMGAILQSCVVNCYITFILNKTTSTAEVDSTLHDTVPHELANIRGILELGIMQNTSSNTFDERQIHALLAYMKWEHFLRTPSTDLLQKVLWALPLPPHLLADCYIQLSSIHMHQDRLAEAEQSVSRALELYQQLQSMRGEAKAHKVLGDVYRCQERLADAEQSLSRALELCQQTEDIVDEANTHRSLAKLYLRQNQLTEAEQSVNRALELYQQEQSILGEANASQILGDIYLCQERLTAAEQSVNRALELYQQIQCIFGEAQAHTTLGDIYQQQEQFTNAERSLSRALQLHQQTRDIFDEANTHQGLGGIYLRQSRLAEAEQSINRALERYQQIQNIFGEAQAHQALGDIYWDQERLDDAEQSLSRALELYQQTQNIFDEANAHRGLGKIYLHQSRFTEAEQSLSRALELYQQTQDIFGEAKAHKILGDVYRCQERLADAEKSLSQALELCHQTQDIMDKANIYRGLAELYLQRDQFDKAEQSLSQALELYQQKQSILGEANVYQILGDLYLRQERLTAAEQSVNRALELYQQIQRISCEARAHTTLGDIYRHQERFTDAEQSLSRALQLHQQMQNILDEANTHQGLGEIYLHQNRLAEARQSLSRAQELYRQIYAVREEARTRRSLEELYLRQDRLAHGQSGRKRVASTEPIGKSEKYRKTS